MKKGTAGHDVRHEQNLSRLSRIEGQVRGVQRMINEGAYCVDIITQIQAAQSALGAVGRRVLRKHLDHCVAGALRSRSEAEVQEKLDELMTVISRKFV